MKNEKYFIMALGLTMVALVLFVYGNSGFKYTVDLNLPPEKKAEYKLKIGEIDKQLRNVTPSNKPDIDLFIEKAVNQEYLGRYGDAINTLLESFKYYQNTSVGWNNIARLYDKVGDYKSAIVFYNKLIDTFRLNNYYLDVAQNYYMLGRYTVAYEAYGRLVQLTKNSDEELLKLIVAKLSKK